MKNKNEKKPFIIRIILILIISVAFGLGIYNWNAKSLTGNVLPMPFGVGFGVVMSGSMEPHLSVGDLIVVKECSEYKLGEYVVFQQNGILIVHEVVYIDDETVITRGSANNSDDAPMKLSAIKGKVVFDVEGVGKIITFIKSPLGTILVLLLAGYFLIRSYTAENAKVTDNAQKLKEIKEEIEKLKQSANDNDGGNVE